VCDHCRGFGTVRGEAVPVEEACFAVFHAGFSDDFGASDLGVLEEKVDIFSGDNGIFVMDDGVSVETAAVIGGGEVKAVAGGGETVLADADGIHGEELLVLHEGQNAVGVEGHLFGTEAVVADDSAGSEAFELLFFEKIIKALGAEICILEGVADHGAAHDMGEIQVFVVVETVTEDGSGGIAENDVMEGGEDIFIEVGADAAAGEGSVFDSNAAVFGDSNAVSAGIEEDTFTEKLFFAVLDADIFFKQEQMFVFVVESFLAVDEDGAFFKFYIGEEVNVGGIGPGDIIHSAGLQELQGLGSGGEGSCRQEKEHGGCREAGQQTAEPAGMEWGQRGPRVFREHAYFS